MQFPKNIDAYFKDYDEYRNFDGYDLIVVLFNTFTFAKVLDQLTTNFQSKDPQLIINCLSFLRDSLLIPFRPEYSEKAKIIKKFRAQFAKSEILLLLEKLLYFDHPAVRADAAYTIGKIYFPEIHTVILERAITVYDKNFPDQLNDLIAEYIWLLGVRQFNSVEAQYKNGSPRVKAAIKFYFDEIFSLSSLDDVLRNKYLRLINSS